MKNILTFVILYLLLGTCNINAQNQFTSSKNYIIDQIVIEGTKTLNNTAVLKIAKINIGDTLAIPSEATAKIINRLWDESLFSNISMDYEILHDNKIRLKLYLEEMSRLEDIKLVGIKNKEKKELDEKLKKYINKVANQYIISQINNNIKKYFIEDGYYNSQIDLAESNSQKTLGKKLLTININKNKKTAIKQIIISGNQDLTNNEIKKVLKNTKEKKFYHIFGPKKFIPKKFQEDKESLIAKYKSIGHKDIKIIKDSVEVNPDNTLNISINVNEGKKYYFGKIEFVGNTVISTKELESILEIHPNDIYNETKLNEKLFASPNEDDISSLYLNSGYLFFRIEPIIENIDNDKINIKIQVFEGKKATINKVAVKGNTRTSDIVILRELRTLPGDTFDKSQLIRSHRELNQLGFFDEQKLSPDVKPNPVSSTVDITYNVAEKSSDQLELSGSFGGGRIIGSLGVTFRNFALNKLFTKDWNGSILPTGRGQTLSIKAQSTGADYQNYMLMFAEPWFGDNKRRLLSLSLSHAISKNFMGKPNFNKIILTNVDVGLGEFLIWPDDYFQLSNSLTFKRYDLHNYQYVGDISTGVAYSISLNPEISRNSLDSPIYPTQGSHLRFGVELTPPYSLLNSINYNDPALPAQEKYKFTEYHKWKLDVSWFTRLIPNTKLIANLRWHWGYIGYYNKKLGTTGFGRFKLGGDGMGGFQYLSAAETIGLRGYENESIYPIGTSPEIGSPIYEKTVLEIRHPIIMSQQASIYVLGFAEAGNTYKDFKNYNPLNLKKSVGIGIRIFLPIFGVLGLDWGYGLDSVPDHQANMGHFHFSINQSLGTGF
ncbi:MAG: outer membrane protein assembly factor BamA [Solitalea-like symbiont of Acarus siro]